MNTHRTVMFCDKSHFNNRFTDISFSEIAGAISFTPNETFNSVAAVIIPLQFDVIPSLIKFSVTNQ